MLHRWLRAHGASGVDEAGQPNIPWPDNLVWLASYPRSGNTYLRALLWACFGLQSGSVYTDDLPRKDGVAGHVGHYEGASRGLFSPEFRRLPLVKTHEWPIDDRKAIYILRDGVQSCLSLHRFLQASGDKVSLDHVITGRHYFGSWSAHVLAWDPLVRPNTLFLRFEDLTGDFAGTVRRLSDFLGVAPIGTAPPQLMEVPGESPQWLSPGRKPKSGLTAAQAEIFDQLHGKTMARFGYALAQPQSTAPAKPVDANAAVVWLCWGEKHLRQAVESARSTLPLGIDRVLITDTATAPLAEASGAFTTIVRTVLGHGSNLDKGRLIDCVPAQYETILFLDADTLVLGDLSLGFAKARQYGIAVAPAPHYNLSGFFGFDRILAEVGIRPAGQMQYNSGVIFCSLKGPGRQVIERYRDLCNAAAPTGWKNDQPLLSLAFEQLGFQPYVLSPLYNYRGLGELAVGDVRVWHSVLPPPADLVSGEPAWPPRRYRDGVRLPV